MYAAVGWENNTQARGSLPLTAATADVVLLSNINSDHRKPLQALPLVPLVECGVPAVSAIVAIALSYRITSSYGNSPVTMALTLDAGVVRPPRPAY